MNMKKKQIKTNKKFFLSMSKKQLISRLAVTSMLMNSVPFSAFADSASNENPVGVETVQTTSCEGSGEAPGLDEESGQSNDTTPNEATTIETPPDEESGQSSKDNTENQEHRLDAKKGVFGNKDLNPPESPMGDVPGETPGDGSVSNYRAVKRSENLKHNYRDQNETYREIDSTEMYNVNNKSFSLVVHQVGSENDKYKEDYEKELYFYSGMPLGSCFYLL